MTQNNKPMTKSDWRITRVVWRLIRSDLDWIGKAILRMVRLSWSDRPVTTRQTPKVHPEPPKGPYLLTRPNHRGDLLLFVPRNLDSLLIDYLTGGYGYSHLAVDCGEIDAPTGKPVMIESTTGEVVGRKYQDEYGHRHYVRIPITKMGVNPEKFCECAASKLGEPYDDLEALTWGDIDDPAKQVCSDLAAVCLPDEMREHIAQQAREHKLRHLAVSVHSRPSTHGVREFISPNGFAQYFGAPPGKKVTQPDQLVNPHLPKETDIIRSNGSPILIMMVIAVVGTVWLLIHNRS